MKNSVKKEDEVKSYNLVIYSNLLFAVFTGGYVVNEVIKGRGISYFFALVTVIAFFSTIYSAIQYKKRKTVDKSEC